MMCFAEFGWQAEVWSNTGLNIVSNSFKQVQTIRCFHHIWMTNRASGIHLLSELDKVCNLQTDMFAWVCICVDPFSAHPALLGWYLLGVFHCIACGNTVWRTVEALFSYDSHHKHNLTYLSLCIIRVCMLDTLTYAFAYACCLLELSVAQTLRIPRLRIVPPSQHLTPRQVAFYPKLLQIELLLWYEGGVAHSLLGTPSGPVFH